MQGTPTFSSFRRQRGLSLFVVVVFVMLSMLLSLWAARTSIFNEIIVGNDADYQRAFEAAQALVQDAELDIRGVNPDGSACAPILGNLDSCRPNGAEVWFPTEDKEIGDIFARLYSEAANQYCFKGICLKRTGNQDFWNDNATLIAMRDENVGARYGQFTNAQSGNQSNPILAFNDPALDKEKGGWYWIEILPYDSNAGNSGLVTNGSTNLPLNLKPNVAYRITAVATGLKASTQVVIQSTYVRQKLKN